MLRNYIVTALRNLWRNKFFSLINIFGLSIGIASCLVIFLYAKDEWTFDRFQEKASQLYRITSDISEDGRETNTSGTTGLMQGPAFSQNLSEIESYVRLESLSCTVKQDNTVFSQDGLWVDENFFSVFSFPLLYGDSRTALKDLHSVVLSEELAEKFFGRKDVVGKTIVLRMEKEFEPFTVSAVAKNSPQNSSIHLQMLFPMAYNLSQQKEPPHWMNFYLNTFVVLKPGVDPVLIAKRMNTIYEKEAAEQIKEMREKYNFKEKITYGLQPFLETHLSKDYPASNGLDHPSRNIYSYILSGIALFILLIACINFVNLSVARSLKRAKEIGVRKVIGGMRRQLIVQFLGESYLLALFSFVIGIVLAALILPFFNAVSDKALSFSYLLDKELVFGYLGLFLLTGLLAGFYPALLLSGFRPVETLYGKFRFNARNYLSRGLVVLQFSLATILIIATSVIYSQFNYLLNYDLGYNTRDIVEVTSGRMKKEKLDLVKEALLREPAIKKVAARQGGGYITIARINGSKEQEFGYNLVDEQTFPLFSIPLVQGRNFSKEFPGDSTSAMLVNETFVKAAGWKTPIGETIDFYYKNKKYRVVGVVKDFHTQALTQKITPQVFSTDPQMSYEVLQVKIDPLLQGVALKHIEKTIREFFPLIPYKYSFMEEDIHDQYKNEAKWKQIILSSAILTVFISCIGLFGLAALSSEKRAKEIGIRKVLGASAALIVRTLSGDFVKLVLLSAVFAIPVAWWAAHKWLENYPYHVKLNILLFLVPEVLVLIIALLAVSSQAIRAAIANPVKSLRSE